VHDGNHVELFRPWNANGGWIMNDGAGRDVNNTMNLFPPASYSPTFGANHVITFDILTRESDHPIFPLSGFCTGEQPTCCCCRRPCRRRSCGRASLRAAPPPPLRSSCGRGTFAVGLSLLPCRSPAGGSMSRQHRMAGRGEVQPRPRSASLERQHDLGAGRFQLCRGLFDAGYGLAGPNTSIVDRLARRNLNRADDGRVVVAASDRPHAREATRWPAAT